MQPSSVRPVAAIKNGTVIDHIPAGHGLRILSLLRLMDHPKIATVGINLPSKRLGMKDLIKLEDRAITPQEIDRIAILAPAATVVRIQNYRVVSKQTLALPEAISSLVVCPNQNCITNFEQMETLFHVQPGGKVARLQCVYCERIFLEGDIKEYATNA